MKTEYDLSKLKSRRNPYASRLKVSLAQNRKVETKCDPRQPPMPTPHRRG